MSIYEVTLVSQTAAVTNVQQRVPDGRNSATESS